MKRLKSLGVLTALATSVVLAVSLVPATSQQAGRETITVCDRNKDGFSKDIDVGKERFSPGDYGVFKDPLRDPQTGDKVASGLGRFMFIKPAGEDGWFMLEFTSMFVDGKISVEGTGKFSDFDGEGFDLTVNGGTGRYEEVRGSANLIAGACGGEKGVVITFNLTLQ